ELDSGQSEVVEMEASQEVHVVRCKEEEDFTVECNTTLQKGLENILKTNEILNGRKTSCSVDVTVYCLTEQMDSYTTFSFCLFRSSHFRFDAKWKRPNRWLWCCRRHPPKRISSTEQQLPRVLPRNSFLGIYRLCCDYTSFVVNVTVKNRLQFGLLSLTTANQKPSLEMENEEKIRMEARRRLEEQLKQYRVQRQKERVSVCCLCFGELSFLVVFM
ncbi:hypothetical protein XENOCAPTIV_024511, partial [Xenoophorus captivus]